MKAQLFQRLAKPVVAQHEPIQSHPDYFAVLDVTDPAVVNQPEHVAHRIEFYRDWVLQHALQDMDWTFTPVTPGLLIEWLLDCPAWRSERGSYFTSTKQRIIKALVEQLLHLQQHATGANKVAHPSHWDTAAFDRWFAGSKIVDKQGNPLQVFHGTNTGPGQDGWFSSGRFGYIYVTPDSNYAEGYGFGDGHKVYPLYAKAHNPLDLRRLGLEAYKGSFQAECKSHGLDFEVTASAMVEPVFLWVRLPGFKEACEAKGYDAIWLRERGGTGQADALLLFNANQLKSAIGNRGTYDAEDPRITASKTADRKGRRQTFQGFSITVEYPSGSFRSGVAPDGTAWRKLMVHDYGHFVGIPAADGDSLDCYLGPDEDAEHAYVVNQLKQDGSFDEHKILLGFSSPQQALAGYLAHMPREWHSFELPKVFTMAELRHWLMTGDQMLKVAGDVRENPAFQAWFNGSKVVDAEGNPIPVYHGTDKKFQAFDLKKTTQGIIWFTNDRAAVEAGEVGAQGSGVILELYACIKNPAGWKEYDQLGIGELIGRGYDGVILPEKDGTFTGIAFQPTQLKAIKNKGTWDPNNKRLTASGSEFNASLKEALGQTEHLKQAAEGEDGPDLGEHGVGTDDSGEFWGDQGAGVIPVAKDSGRVLLQLRSEFVNEPGTWGVWGGAIEAKEDPMAAIRREFVEEAGYSGPIDLKPLHVYRKDDFKYTTALGYVPTEFIPRLDWETEDYRWCTPGDWPSPLHFGVKELLPKLEAATMHEEAEEGTEKKASTAQNTINRWYGPVAEAVQDGVNTFNEFVNKLQQKLGADFTAMLNDAGGYAGLREIWDHVIEHDADDFEHSLEDKRISPRLPTGKKSTEDPHHPTERLQPGLEAMSRDEETLAHNVALMQTYPGFGNLQGTPQEKAEKIIQLMKDNLIWLYNEWEHGLKRRSKLWYVGGNRLIHRWAKRFQMDPHQIAAIIAALSPQRDWFTNVSLAERVLVAMREHPDFRWDKAMTEVTFQKDSKGNDGWGAKVVKQLGMSPQELAKQVEGKSLRELEGKDAESIYKMAIWIRAWDQAHNPNAHRTLSPEGEFGDWDRKSNGQPIKNRWGSFSEITKAVMMIEAAGPREVSDLVSANHKVRSFYNNLIAPYSKGGDVTVDTHAVAAALLRPLSSAHREVAHNFGMGVAGEAGPASSKITGSTGLYGLYAEAYRRAADEVGVLPRELQSITWEAVRGLFKPHMKRNEGLINQINSTWEDYGNGKLQGDAARNRIHDLAGGVDLPAWARPSAGSHATERDSSYAGELSGPQPTGRRGALEPRGGDGTPRGVQAAQHAGVSFTNLQVRLSRVAAAMSRSEVSA